MQLTISTIDKVLFSGEAESVIVPGSSGMMTVLSHHTPLVSTLRKGTIVVKTKEEKPTEFDIESGFLEIGKKGTVILV
jgi:F-type H+-transporting ATPase subunit epsilon